MEEIMNLEKYITDEAKIEMIKNEYLCNNLSIKDMLNGAYSDLPIEDKINLICWSSDNEKFKVLKTGKVVNKYTLNELLKHVKKYAKEDSCVHYIIEESDGSITQTCDVWVDYDIDAYVKENNVKVLAVVNP